MESMDSQSRKKRTLLINPKFQWTLIGYGAAGATMILITVYLLITYGFQRFIELGNSLGMPPEENVYFQFIKMQQESFNQIILAIALIVGLVLIIGGLIVSHKIAGPIYRMQKEFFRMRELPPDELFEIKFRKGDFFPELAESFNVLVRSWREKK
jgi:hypothetical protein